MRCRASPHPLSLSHTPHTRLSSVLPCRRFRSVGMVVSARGPLDGRLRGGAIACRLQAVASPLPTLSGTRLVGRWWAQSWCCLPGGAPHQLLNDRIPSFWVSVMSLHLKYPRKVYSRISCHLLRHVSHQSLHLRQRVQRSSTKCSAKVRRGSSISSSCHAVIPSGFLQSCRPTLHSSNGLAPMARRMMRSSRLTVSCPPVRERCGRSGQRDPAGPPTRSLGRCEGPAARR